MMVVVQLLQWIHMIKWWMI